MHTADDAPERDAGGPEPVFYPARRSPGRGLERERVSPVIGRILEGARRLIQRNKRRRRPGQSSPRARPFICVIPLPTLPPQLFPRPVPRT